MFWVLPREHAERALGRSLKVLVECSVGQACCNSSFLTGRSMWIIQYWSAHAGYRVEANALLGSAVVARNGAKGMTRNCTLHLGCWHTNKPWFAPSEELERASADHRSGSSAAEEEHGVM